MSSEAAGVGGVSNTQTHSCQTQVHTTTLNHSTCHTICWTFSGFTS